MKSILVVLSTASTPEEALDFAVARARKEGLTLVALYLLEKGFASEAFDTFTDIGFIGDKPSTELSEALMREYRQRGYEELGKVQIKAMEAGVGYEPVMEEGEYVTTVLDMIDRYGSVVAVLVKRREKSIMKFFSKSPADEVKDLASCEVAVFSEDGR